MSIFQDLHFTGCKISIIIQSYKMYFIFSLVFKLSSGSLRRNNVLNSQLCHLHFNLQTIEFSAITLDFKYSTQV